MKDNGGSIINVGFDCTLPWTMMGHSSAARAGVESLTKCMSVEWAASGVRVNLVAPGYIVNETAKANYGVFPMYEWAPPRIPAKRNGTTQEVASAVCFLLSPGAQYISGATLTVDGGVINCWEQQYKVPDHDNIPPYQWN